MTIGVKIWLMPALRRLRRETSFELELPNDATVKTMLREIGFQENEIENLIVFIGGKLVPLDKKLKDGDDIQVGAPIGGGYGISSPENDR